MTNFWYDLICILLGIMVLVIYVRCKLWIERESRRISEYEEALGRLHQSNAQSAQLSDSFIINMPNGAEDRPPSYEQVERQNGLPSYEEAMQQEKV